MLNRCVCFWGVMSCVFRLRERKLDSAPAAANHDLGAHPNSLTQNDVFITSTHTHSPYTPVAINTKFNRFAVLLRTCVPEHNHHILKAILVAKVELVACEIVEKHGQFMCASFFCTPLATRRKLAKQHVVRNSRFD